MFDDVAIMGELPASLRHDIVLHRFEGSLQMVPFLKGIREDVCLKLCLQVGLSSSDHRLAIGGKVIK